MKPARFFAVATGAAVLSHLYGLLSAAEPPPPIYIGPTSSAPRVVAQQPATSASRSVPEPTPVNGTPPPSAPAQQSTADLEKLVMPIALHPDPLVAIILPAAAYPVEIVQAARFVRDTNNIAKIDQQSWDANVKAVAKFPDLIAKLDADLSWTVALGQAFVDHPKELMDTIQELRAKARKAGTLRSSDQQIISVTNVVVVQTNLTQVVTVTNEIVQVQPSNPQVVYVPSYPPTVYAPPPSYVYDPVAPLVTFGVGMAMGAIIANNCDWHHGGVYWGGGDVDIDINNDINIDRGDRPDRPNQRGNAASPTQQKWQPDQNRMRNSGAPSAQTREARGWGNASQTPGQRPATGGAGGARPSQMPSAGAGGARPSAQPSVGQRPGGGAGAGSSFGGGSRPPSSSSFNRPSSQPSSAFGGVNSGSSARSVSNRGAASRGGGGGFRGGGGRGGGRR